MLAVDHFARIREFRRDGLTIRQIAAELGHSPKTILKALESAEPPRFQVPVRAARVFGPFQALVDAIVEADRTAPRKQRHTAMQIYRRLVAEHRYPGSYDQVRRYLQGRRLDQRETFIPLDHPPGHRCEADFGHIHVDFPTGRQLVPVLVVTWSYSNAPFAIAVPTERVEAILHGLNEAFRFFGCVPKELWWDNPTTVAIHIHRGRDRTLHARYAACASHYLFTPKFCLPATPQEKPRVENRVKDLERMWATPVPQVKDLDALNVHLRQWCVTTRERTCGTNAETVGTRFERDRAAALPVPTRAFDACVMTPGSVDKYQTVAFDGNRYSVPRRFAFRTVNVKGYIDRVEIVADHRIVATHVRGYARHDRVLDPLHFLVILHEKPAALDHAPVYRDWALPPAFAALRTHFETRLGLRAGARQYIRVLQLLTRFAMDVLEPAIAHHLANGDPSVANITTTAERMASSNSKLSSNDTALSLSDSKQSLVAVPRPDLARFDRLLTRSPEGDDRARSDRDAAQGQPQAVEAADHAGRAREAGPRGRDA
jgi:transposase